MFYKVHMHAGATRQLLYGCVYVREIKPFRTFAQTIQNLHLVVLFSLNQDICQS